MHRVIIGDKRPAPNQIAVGGCIQKFRDGLLRVARIQHILQRSDGVIFAYIKSVALGVLCIVWGWIRGPAFQTMAALGSGFSITTCASTGIIATLLGSNLGSAGGAGGSLDWVTLQLNQRLHPVPNLPEMRLIGYVADIRCNHQRNGGCHTGKLIPKTGHPGFQFIRQCATRRVLLLLSRTKVLQHLCARIVERGCC